MYKNGLNDVNGLHTCYMNQKTISNPSSHDVGKYIQKKTHTKEGEGDKNTINTEKCIHILIRIEFYI